MPVQELCPARSYASPGLMPGQEVCLGKSYGSQRLPKFSEPVHICLNIAKHIQCVLGLAAVEGALEQCVCVKFREVNILLRTCTLLKNVVNQWVVSYFHETGRIC